MWLPWFGGEGPCASPGLSAIPLYCVALGHPLQDEIILEFMVLVKETGNIYLFKNHTCQCTDRLFTGTAVLVPVHPSDRR